MSEFQFYGMVGQALRSVPHSCDKEEHIITVREDLKMKNDMSLYGGDKEDITLSCQEVLSEVEDVRKAQILDNEKI